MLCFELNLQSTRILCVKQAKKGADKVSRFYLFLTGVSFCLYLSIFSSAVSAEEMTITTYYPSPNGAYDAMNVKRLSVGDTNGDGNVNASDVPSSDGYLSVADRLGIGTKTPSSPLYILSTAFPQFRIVYPGGNDPFSIYVDESNSNKVKVWLSPGDDFDASSANDYLVIGDYATATEKFWFRGDGVSYFSGNVGIGTTSPTAKLQIYDGTYSSGFSGYCISLGRNSWNYIQTTETGSHLAIKTNGTAWEDVKMVIANTGNVGIGTTSPSSLLDVNGTTQLRGSSGGTGLYVNSSGNVGIGTTSPAYGLDVQSGGFRIGDHFTASIGCADFKLGYSGRRGSPGRAIVDLGNALAFNYAADWTNTYIYGTVSYPSTEEIKKDIKYLTKKDYEYLLDQVRTYDISRYHYKKESPQDSYHLGLIAEHSPKDVVTDDGKAIKAVDYISLVFGGLKALALQVDEMADTRMSDIRLKDNLIPLDGVLDSLKKLKGVRFNWKNKSFGTRQEIGIIAQEVEKEFPQLVYTDPRSGYKFVKYEKFTPVLIEAIKEQQKEIEELRKEIRTLRKNLPPRAE